jgi:hypothetical protein
MEWNCTPLQKKNCNIYLDTVQNGLNNFLLKISNNVTFVSNISIVFSMHKVALLSLFSISLILICLVFVSLSRHWLEFDLIAISDLTQALKTENREKKIRLLENSCRYFEMSRLRSLYQPGFCLSMSDNQIIINKIVFWVNFVNTRHNNYWNVWLSFCDKFVDV